MISVFFASSERSINSERCSLNIFAASETASLGAYGAVGQHLKRQLVKVRDISDTGIFNAVTYIVNRREDRISEHNAYDRRSHLLVFIGRDVSSAPAECDLHIERIALFNGCYMMIGIKYLDVSVRLDVTGGNGAGRL